MFSLASVVFMKVVLITAIADSNLRWKLIKRCPFTEEEWKMQAKKHPCETKKGITYHCMLDNKGNSIELCMAVKEIKNGCPWIFISLDGNIFPGNQGTQCDGNAYCPRPEETFLTNQLFKYPACLVNESMRANFTLEDYVTQSSDQNSSIAHTTLESDQDLLELWKTSFLWSVAGLFPSCVLLVMIAVACCHKTANTRDNETDFEAGDIGEREALISNSIHTFEEPEALSTENVEKALKMILNDGMVILVGDTGTGKTTSLEQILHEFEQEAQKYHKWQIKRTEYDIDKDMRENESKIYSQRIMVCLDDCCGKYNTDPAKLNLMKRTIQRYRHLAKDCDWRKFILTLRTKEFRFITSFLTQEDLIACAVLLDKTSESERKELLDKHITCSKKCNLGEQIDWNRVTRTFEREQYLSHFGALGWPLICRLAVVPQFAKNISIFVSNPLKTLLEEVDKLKMNDTVTYCSMVYMMLKGGALDERSLDHEFFKEIVQLSSAMPDHANDLVPLRNLIVESLKCVPEYVKNNNGKFTFFHEIMLLAVFCTFHKEQHNDTIRLCDLQIIAEIFRPENYDYSQEGGVNPLMNELNAVTEDEESIFYPAEEDLPEYNTGNNDFSTNDREIKDSSINEDVTGRHEQNCENGTKMETFDNDLGGKVSSHSVTEHNAGKSLSVFTLYVEQIAVLMGRLSEEDKHSFEKHPLMKHTF